MGERTRCSMWTCVIEAGKVCALCGGQWRRQDDIDEAFLPVCFCLSAAACASMDSRCAALTAPGIAYLPDESSFSDHMQVGKIRLLYETFYADFDPVSCGRLLDRYAFRDNMRLRQHEPGHPDIA